jgi:hypothetical protein
VIIDASAPDQLKIQATTIADGSVRAEGALRPNGKLEFEGGISAQLGISLSQFNFSRKYKFTGAPVSMVLPYIVQTLSWQATDGKAY